MYQKVPTSMDFVAREHEISAFWKENDIFKKSIEAREGCPVFTFYDGPPTANGKPHIGHIITRAVKDIIPRYRTMKGYKVLRKAGWDTHGLPVELEVEKMLGISGKPQIESYGVEPFIEKCKESVWKYEGEWRRMSDLVGFWADMDNPYVTYHNSYIESEWWALKQIAEKGLLYQGHKVVPYCPRCGTALSSHEVAQGYKDVKETSAIAKFPVREREKEYLLAWTTTPWTLPSNVALCVNPGETYVRVRVGGEIYILAEALLKSVLGEDADAEVLESMTGAELCGLRYEPLFDFMADDETGFRVVADNYVTMDDGTGIVHIAPAFGEDDARVGRQNGLPFRQYVNAQGHMTEETGPFADLFIKDADKPVLDYLEEHGRLFAALPFEHNYPFCWRCDTPLIYYARDTWFIEMTKLRDNLVKNNRTVNWIPENIKEGRFGNFLENVIDWGLSRERYWGTPLPVWTCTCGHRHVVGSIGELKEMSPDCPEEIELHKPYIDRVHLTCPKCGGQMTRVPEVIDCWFDSGSMPFAQWHYPFENHELFHENYPADFISEAIDQTRGWFYTLMAISTLLFDRAPYKNVLVLGHVQDKNGQKMSKHKGNVVDPFAVLGKQGADAVRWYFYTNSAPWLPSRFYEEAVNESQRKFMGTLWNTYAFYILYADIDQFDPTRYVLDYDTLAPMDKWLLSRLQTLVTYVDESLEQYKLTEPGRAMQDFVDELSNWYVRRCRQRFWAKGMEQDKINAYMTLYTALVTLSKLAAPFIPFMTEAMYRNLVLSVDPKAPESVHLCDFPQANPAWIDKELEEDMALVLQLVVQGRSARNLANRKNRQPLAKMYVQSEKTLPESFQSIVAEELNVKALEFVSDAEAFTGYQCKPQLRTLGKKYGKLVPKIGQHLAEADGSQIVKTLKTEGVYRFTIDGEAVELGPDDVLTQTVEKAGYYTISDKGVTVVLDANLTDELVEEGFVRELVSKLQTMRKEAGVEVTDRIAVTHEGSPRIEEIFARNSRQILSDVLGDDLAVGAKGYVKEWNINGETVTLGVEKR